MATHIEVNGTADNKFVRQEWEKEIQRLYGRSWGELNLKQRKDYLLAFCRESVLTFNCIGVIEYVTNVYRMSPLDDLKGTKAEQCVVVRLSHNYPDLAVKVFKTNPTAYSLFILPSLVAQGINKPVLSRIIQESGKRHGALVADCGEIETRETNKGRTSISTLVDDPGTFFDEIEEMLRKKSSENVELDSLIMQSLAKKSVDIFTIRSKRGNALHLAAKHGLVVTAKEIISQGYQKLLLEPAKVGRECWPLTVAVREKKWEVVKLFLDSLRCNQKRWQISCIQQMPGVCINVKKVVSEIRSYEKTSWIWEVFRSEDPCEKEILKGQVAFVNAVLDTAVKGHAVKASLLFDQEGSINEIDGNGSAHNGTLYDHIARSKNTEIQGHPCFTAAVEHKWSKSYGYLHGVLFFLYILYLLCLITSLTLASKTTDPRKYQTGCDGLRLFCGIMSILYLSLVCGINCTRIWYYTWTTLKSEKRKAMNTSPTLKSGKQKAMKNIILEHVSVHNTLEVCRYSFILLIIPLRIADNDWQWTLASVAVILNGLRLFHYATVLPWMGTYVGTLFLMMKKDIPRLLLVFLVINISFGAGLYFSLVGYYNNDNIDTVNDNTTSNIYNVWFVGVRLVLQESVLTYYGPNGFNWCGAIIYWLLVFSICVAFLAILTAQFTRSFENLDEQAHIKCIRRKMAIIQKIDETLALYPFVCLKELGAEKAKELAFNISPSDNKMLQVSLVYEMDRRFAESEKRVHKLQETLDELSTLVKQCMHPVRRRESILEDETFD